MHIAAAVVGLRAKLEAKLHGHKNVLPAVGVAAGVVAAYAAVSLLHRGSGTSAIAPAPVSAAYGSDLGTGSGMPFDFGSSPVTAMPIGAPIPVGGGGYDPVMPVYPEPWPTLVAGPGTIAASPPPAPQVAAPRAAAPPPAGQSSGGIAPATHYAAPSSSYATQPGTVTPVGGIPVARTVSAPSVAVARTISDGTRPMSGALYEGGPNTPAVSAPAAAAPMLPMVNTAGQVVLVPHALANLLGSAAANQVAAPKAPATVQAAAPSGAVRTVSTGAAPVRAALYEGAGGTAGVKVAQAAAAKAAATKAAAQAAAAKAAATKAAAAKAAATKAAAAKAAAAAAAAKAKAAATAAGHPRAL
jgi:hypothetical protein